MSISESSSGSDVLYSESSKVVSGDKFSFENSDIIDRNTGGMNKLFFFIKNYIKIEYILFIYFTV